MTVYNKTKNALVWGLLLSPIATFAAPVVPSGLLADPPTGSGPIQKGEDVIGILSMFAGWASIAFWILAFIFMLRAAFKYFTAGGNPEQIKEANKNLLWGVIAIVVGLMAYGIVSFVKNTLDVGA